MPFKKGVTPPGANIWEKGKSGNPNGRPRKIASQLKAIGYTKAEAYDTINAMLAMTLEELKQIYTNDNSTVLEKTIAGALKKSLEKGSLYSLDSLLDRTHGKATEKILQEQEGDIKIKVIYERKGNNTE